MMDRTGRERMKKILQSHWAEGLLCMTILFFAFRELGTFPAAWEDDSLFMLVARNLAEGRGYVLPVLDQRWHFPFLLGVGPTIILPAAASIWLFGFTVAAARLPFAVIVVLAAAMVYVFTRRVDQKQNARWATALCITLSAFVNTGKPVLGEVPAFLFLMLGVWQFQRSQSTRSLVCTGLWLGIAVVTKITYGILFPALALAWILAAAARDWALIRRLTLVGITAALPFIAWRLVEIGHAPGSWLEIVQYGLAGGGKDVLHVFRSEPALLLRFQYPYFFGLLGLSYMGLLRLRTRLQPGLPVFIGAFIGLFVLYFLNGEGWYRHLLPAHLLLLPFVPAGAFALLGRRASAAVLIVCIVAQTWWQITYHGSSRFPEAADAAAKILASHAEEPMVISDPAVAARLPYSPHRWFLSAEFQKRDFVIFPKLALTQEEHCLPLLQKISLADQPALGERMRTVHRRYILLDPPASCRSAP